MYQRQETHRSRPRRKRQTLKCGSGEETSLRSAPVAEIRLTSCLSYWSLRGNLRQAPLQCPCQYQTHPQLHLSQPEHSTPVCKPPFCADLAGSGRSCLVLGAKDDAREFGLI